MREHYFYGQPILPDMEEDYIKYILEKYKNEPANEKLKKKIWDELQEAKYEGRVTIPFKVILKEDVYNQYPPSIQVILDTKV